LFKILTIGLSIVLSFFVGQEPVDVESVDYSDVFVYAVNQVPEHVSPVTLGDIIATKSAGGCPAEGQCVYLLKERGFDTKGNAIDIKPNTPDPCRSCAILMYGGRFGHVGIVYDYDSDYVCFEEKNYLGCNILNTRCVPRNSTIIRGYLIQ
jgi:hypothetical protein